MDIDALKQKIRTMKVYFYLFTAIVTLSFSSCVFEGWNYGVSGNGTVVEEVRDITDFTGIHVSSGIDVILRQGDNFEVRVEADENLMDIILTEMKGNILVVKTEKYGIRRARSSRVHVTMPELSDLKISSAGDCVGQTPFECKKLDVDVSSAGNLSLEVTAAEIYLDISSSGDARLSGKTGYLDVSLSSAGDLYAFDLIAGVVDVTVSSAGDARVYASEEISMDVSSAGNIFYRGDAKVAHSRSTSAGDIIRED